MSIVKRQQDGSFQIVSGYTRLKVTLEVEGKAQVRVVGSNENLFVHEVDGKLVAISEDAQANVDDLTQAIINQARS